MIIARGDTPVVKLVPIRRKPFKYDILADQVKGPIPDFEPLIADDLDRLEREKEERIARGSA